MRSSSIAAAGAGIIGPMGRFGMGWLRGAAGFGLLVAVSAVSGCSGDDLGSLGGGPCGQAREVPGPVPLEAHLTTFTREEPLPAVPDCVETTGSAGLTLFRVGQAGLYRVTATADEEAVISVHRLTGEGSDCTEAIECAEFASGWSGFGGAGGAAASLGGLVEIQAERDEQLVVAVIGVSESTTFDYDLYVDFAP